MNINIKFDIGDLVWFIHPSTMKSVCAELLGVKVHVSKGSTKIKYHVDCKKSLVIDHPEVYVWDIFKSKDDLLDSL